jgi:hypothetical protein
MLGGMTELASFIAVLGSSLFAGAALYISLVEHPARLACGTELAVTQWAPSYWPEEESVDCKGERHSALLTSARTASRIRL